MSPPCNCVIDNFGTCRAGGHGELYIAPLLVSFPDYHTHGERQSGNPPAVRVRVWPLETTRLSGSWMHTCNCLCICGEPHASAVSRQIFCIRSRNEGNQSVTQNEVQVLTSLKPETITTTKLTTVLYILHTSPSIHIQQCSMGTLTTSDTL